MMINKNASLRSRKSLNKLDERSVVKWIFPCLIFCSYLQPVFAVVGAKATGKIQQSGNDRPVLRPANGDYSMSGNKHRDYVPYDHQESEFSKFTGEESANLIERNEKNLCQSSNQDFLFLFRIADNFMRAAVPNFKGPLGTGVCWWLTDFQFNFLFLTYVNPRGSKPSFKVKENIVDQIIAGSSISELSGYKSLEEFMQDEEVQQIIKSKISNKYLIDSFLKFRWAQQRPRSQSRDMAQQYENIDSFLRTNKLPVPLYVDLEGPPSHTLIALKTSEMPPVVSSVPGESDQVIHVLDTNAVPAYLSYKRTSKKFFANMGPLKRGVKFEKKRQGFPKMKLHEPKVYIDRIERYRGMKQLLDNFCKSKGFSNGANLQIPESFFRN